MCEERGARFYCPANEFLIDNAAMIGYLGEGLYKKGYKSDLYLSAEPNLEVVNAD